MLNNQVNFQTPSFDQEGYNDGLYLQYSANVLNQSFLNKPYSLKFGNLRHTGICNVGVNGTLSLGRFIFYLQACTN